MTQDQINTRNMIDTVLSGLKEDPGKWEGKDPIAQRVTNVEAYRSEITGLEYDQASAKTPGATKVLHSGLDTMASLTTQTIQRLRPYAIAEDNPELLAAVDFSPSELSQVKQQVSVNRCKIVYEQAKKYQGQMDGYELNDDLLDALGFAVNGVALQTGQRDAIIGAGKTATEAIPVLLNKAVGQLKQLDDLIPALVADEKFVQTYKNNRRIIDR